MKLLLTIICLLGVSTAQWSAEIQDVYMNECIAGLEDEGYGTGTATNFCECTMEYWMEDYPNPEALGEMSSAKMDAISEKYTEYCQEELDGESTQLSEEDIQFWTEFGEEFMSSCTEGDDSKTAYCECAMDKLIEAAPTPEEMNELVKDLDKVQRIAAQCN